MRIAWTIGLALALCTFATWPAHAVGSSQWADGLLHLGLSYPSSWKIVPEHGARLKLVAPGAAGEFEIIDLGAQLAPTVFVHRADLALASLHCATKIAHFAGPIGHLGVQGATATGVCTGGDLGWRLGITSFDHHGHGVLVRSWLFHAQRRDGADLVAMAASLAPVG